MPVKDDQRSPRARVLFLIVAFLIAVLSFGQPLAAYAVPPPSSSDTATPAAQDQAAKDQAADEKTVEPSSTPSATPSTTPSPAPSATDKSPTAAPSKDPTSKEPTAESSSTEPTGKPTAEQPSESAKPSPTTSEPTEKTPAATTPDDKVVQRVVPPATGNNAVITVKVGGDRSGVSSVVPLTGVVLGFYANAAGGTPLFQCTSDSDGDCSVTVPNTQSGGANRDARYYVRQISAPAGWRANGSLRTGDGDGTNSQATPYVFRTGTQLQAGTVYSSQNQFMIGSGNTNRVASGGIWQQSRTNPTLPASCGLDVALILDLSGSVGAALPNLKSAADQFTNSLVGTPSRMSLFSFSTVSPAVGASQNYPSLTSVSTQAQADAFKTRYTSWTSNGGTNWDHALSRVASAPDVPDIAVIITDGSPTYYNSPAEGPGNFTRLREMENGIFSANALKAQGTRVVAVGVGAGVDDTITAQNLAAISGPAEGSDYYQATDYSAAATALRALALGNCAGSISVVKQIVPSANTGENITGSTPAGAGWVFNGSSSNATIGGLPSTKTTTGDGTGSVNFPLTFPGGTTTAPVTLRETQQSGYALVTQSSQNAVCRNLNTGAAVTVINDNSMSGQPGFTVNAPNTEAISCTMYNRAPQPQASIAVTKQWVINGTTYANGAQPSSFQSQLQLTGPGGAPASNQGWGVVRTGYVVGNTSTISEQVTLPGDLCTNVARVTQANGATVSAALPYTAGLTQPANTYQITNTVTCQSLLSLTKVVQGGPASPTGWTLRAIAPAGALPGPNGTTGSTGATDIPVTEGVTYQLAESGGNSNYRQIDNRTDLETNPLSTGSMSCVQVDAAGNQIPGFADGLNGGVQVPIGTRVRCTAVNQTSTLSLRKVVINDNGGTAVPGNWQLTATPTGPLPLPAGVGPVTITGSASFQSFNVRPGISYQLTESTLAGYVTDAISCDIRPGAPRDFFDLTLQPLDTALCTFTNNDQAASLTLVKQVNNGTTGGTATPAQWTLSAAGPTPITGTSGSTAVTNAAVSAGAYTLSESTGPAGYAAGAWSCTGATATGSSVTVPLGGNVSCTIVNTAQQARLTLVKTVTNDNGGTALPAAWTLAAAGPTTGISGATGTAPVTSVAVSPGTYTLSETGPAGYTPGAWSCTAGTLNGSSLVLALGQNATCTINNNDQQARLTLIKTVTNSNGGTAVPTAWTLAAAGPTPISGITGAAAVTNAPVNAGTYTLSESGGPAGYTPETWSCTAGTLTGSSLALGAGASATCTINNAAQPATLTLVKVVDQANTGATAAPGDWTLSAVTGARTVSGPGNSPQVTNQTVPAGTYDLSESGGPTGYTPGAWSCVGAAVTGGSVAVPNGGNVTCTITNTAAQPRLTLVKVVDNGTTGGTALPASWTLSAAGPSTVTGAGNSAQVTNQAVRVGDYSLSESGGPAGYTASAWTCTGAASFSATGVTIAAGNNATCTITNTAQQPTLTLVKTVTNDNGGTAVPTAWTLTGAGPTAGVSGTTGAAAVTSRPVAIGSYALSESGGPDGYAAGAWSCTGGTLTGSSVGVTLGANVSCTINNNDQAATLTLVKTVTNDNGGTAAETAWTLAAAGPTPISGITGTAPVTGAPVSAGTYTLSESDGPAGYAAGSWSCTAGTLTGSSLALPLDTSATCTINNNDIGPRLTLVKTVTNDNGGTATPTRWTLTGTGPTTISGATGSVPVTNAAVDAGTYVLSETGPAGYAAGPWSCVGATAVGDTVALPLSANVTCTINNNDAPAALTLVKVVDNGLTGATRVPADWTLSANGPTPITGPGNSTDVTNQPVNAGSYVLSESGGPNGYTASAWSCTGGTLTGNNVVVPSGGNVSCTITNTAQQPRLTLVKAVDNGTTGGSALPADWTLTAVSGGSIVTGAGNSAAVTDQAVPVGDWSLSESGGPAGYTAGTWSCTGAAFAGTTVTILPGTVATCTITNTAQQAHLTLVKTVTNDNGGTAVPTAWTLSAAGPTTGITGATGASTVTNVAVAPGAYSLAESGGPAGYAAGAWSCTAGTLSGATVTLALGQNATCTIANNDQPASLTLVKTVTNDDGGTADATEWTLSAAGPTPISGATGSDPVTAAAVSAGTYTLSESGGPDGYTAGDWSCTGATLSGSSLVIANGATAVCTIDNDDAPAQLTLVKTVTNDNGGTAVPTRWVLSAAGPTPITGTTGSTAVTDASVSAGSYTLAESGGPAGYSPGPWSCTGAVLTGATVVVPNGGDVTCTIDNADLPATLTLVKDVDNGTTGATADPADWTLSADGTGDTSISGPGNSPQVTNQTVDAGSYSLAESGGPDGYTASAWSCTGGTLDGAIVSVPNDGDVTCTITNTADQPTLSLVKEVVNEGGGTAVPSEWTLSAAGPVRVSGPGNSAGVTDQAVPVGTYELSEAGGPAGFDASDWTCTGAASSTATSVTIAPGNEASCFIVNSAVEATLTLIKDVDNGNTGATTEPTAWTLTAAGPNTIEGPTGTAAAALPGTYDLSESGPTGYDASDWTCSGAASSTADSVTVALGNNVVCAVTNTAQQPTLTLVKQVVNDNGGTAVPTDWTLVADGPTPISGQVGDVAVTDAPVAIGDYDLDEQALLTGYTRGAWACVGGALAGDTVSIALAEDVTCTIVNNDQPAQLTLVKTVANPPSTGGAAVPTDWTLSASGPTSISGTTGDAAITDAVVSAGDYTLAEAAGPDGYAAGNWTCGNGAQVVGDVVTVPNGGDITCQLTNTAQQPHLTLVKTVTNDNGGTAVPTDWTLSATGPTLGVIGRVGADEVTGAPVQAGAYALAESNGPSGYAAGDWSCIGGTVSGGTVTVGVGADVTCTIANDDQPAQLTLVKQVEVGGSGATTPAAAWTLSADGPTPISGATGSDDVTGAAVDAGSYNLSESGPVGFTASAWDCGDAIRAGATVTVPTGGTVTCTIVNTAVAPTLTLVKVVDPGDTGATETADDWALTADGPTLFTVTSGTSTGAQVGTYDLSESGPDGFDGSDWVCTGATASTPTSVTLALDQNATCTITNTAQQPTLTLVKTVTNDDGGTAVPTDWTLGAAGPTSGVSGPTGSGPVTDVPVAIGSYVLSETNGPTGYTAGAWSCVGGSLNGTTVSVALGDQVICTIDNDDQLGIWSLAKASSPASGSTVEPGELITYVITATKTGGVNPVDRVVNDDLSDVLDNATLVGGPTASTGTASLTGTTLTWNISTLADTETVSYTVQVNPDAFGVTIGNVATGEGSSTCPPADPDEGCTTTHVTPHYVLTKSSDPASGSTVLPGETITYTLTAFNDSEAVLSGAVVTDDLSDVLGNATVQSVGPGGVVADTRLTWTLPTVRPGQTVTLTYVVVVDAGAYDETIGNVATPGPGGECVVAADCTTTHPTPHYTLVKNSDPGSGTTVSPGDDIFYTLKVTNDSDGVVSGAIVTDDLSGVLAHATLRSVGDGGSVTGTTLTWTVPTLQPGEIATLDYSVTVNDDAYNQTLENVATPGPGGGCTAPGDCTTTNPTPHYTLSKASDPASGSTVNPGDTVTYTLTTTNDSQGIVADAVVTDDLTDVLDNATLGTVGASGSVTGTTLSWTVPTLQPGESATLSYTVEVDPGAYDVSLGNIATPGPGGECAQPTDCTTTHPTPHYTLTKASDPESGSTVNPGDTISYTLTATNDSEGIVTGAVVTDDLTDVLDDATIGTVGAGGSLTGSTLTWTVPTLEPGQSATLTYDVAVNEGQWGVTLRNVAAPGPGGDCVQEPAGCSTRQVTPRWLLAKSSDPVSGSTVTTGSSITYTLTARNVSEAVVANAVATDDLSDVLDNATLDAVPAGATVSGTTLRWALPTLQPGELTTLAYTVTVDDDAVNQTLRNVATPGGGGECVRADEMENLRQRGSPAVAADIAMAADVALAAEPEVCSTSHFTPEWTLSKSSDPASGSKVQPGSTVSYTLTARNVSNGVVEAATATDDLAAVLNHATLVQPLPAGASLSGSTLTWTVPTLDPGDSATLSYRVRLDDDAWDTSITNVVTPSDGGRCVDSCTTNHLTPPKPHETNLPNTGGPALAVVGVGLALLLGGGGLMLWSRRRKAD